MAATHRQQGAGPGRAPRGRDERDHHPAGPRQVNIGTEAEPLIVPVAFYAVVSVAVIGLYLAFPHPDLAAVADGDAFVPGSWNNGAKYKWMNLIAVIEIAIISIYFILPFVPAGVPFSQDFDWKFVNYAPILPSAR